jgi:nicotinamide-nucleotide amidase
VSTGGTVDRVVGASRVNDVRGWGRATEAAAGYGARMLSSTLTEPAADVARRLIARDQTVAVAESSAGGLISAALLSVPGASAYYRGGLIVYTLAGATALLAGATDRDPGKRGACEPFAKYLAASAAAKLDADWGIGETGATGPSGNPYGDPAGHAWLAVAAPDGTVRARHALTGADDRVANMETFAVMALGLLADALG